MKINKKTQRELSGYDDHEDINYPDPMSFKMVVWLSKTNHALS